MTGCPSLCSARGIQNGSERTDLKGQHPSPDQIATVHQRVRRWRRREVFNHGSWPPPLFPAHPSGQHPDRPSRPARAVEAAAGLILLSSGGGRRIRTSHTDDQLVVGDSEPTDMATARLRNKRRSGSEKGATRTELSDRLALEHHRMSPEQIPSKSGDRHLALVRPALSEQDLPRLEPKLVNVTSVRDVVPSDVAVSSPGSMCSRPITRSTPSATGSSAVSFTRRTLRRTSHSLQPGFKQPFATLSQLGLFAHQPIEQVDDGLDIVARTRDPTPPTPSTPARASLLHLLESLQRQTCVSHRVESKGCIPVPRARRTLQPSRTPPRQQTSGTRSRCAVGAQREVSSSVRSRELRSAHR